MLHSPVGAALVTMLGGKAAVMNYCYGAWMSVAGFGPISTVDVGLIKIFPSGSKWRTNQQRWYPWSPITSLA